MFINIHVNHEGKTFSHFTQSLFRKTCVIKVEAMLQKYIIYFIRTYIHFLYCVQWTLYGKQRWCFFHPYSQIWRLSQCYERFVFWLHIVRNVFFLNYVHVFCKWITGQTDRQTYRHTEIHSSWCSRKGALIYRETKHEICGRVLRGYINWLDKRLLAFEEDFHFLRLTYCSFNWLLIRQFSTVRLKIHKRKCLCIKYLVTCYVRNFIVFGFPNFRFF
jgi:hypothetical protein